MDNQLPLPVFLVISSLYFRELPTPFPVPFRDKLFSLGFQLPPLLAFAFTALTLLPRTGHLFLTPSPLSVRVPRFQSLVPFLSSTHTCFLSDFINVVAKLN